MVRIHNVATLAFALATAAGCGAAAPATVVDQPDMAQAAAPPDLVWAPGAYPAGPYGTAKGDTMFNIRGQGYKLTVDQTDATQLTIGEVNMDIIRTNPACTCGILSQSAIWCGPCNAEQDAWVTAVQDDPGFCPINVLLQDGNYAPAQPKDLITWNQRHSQNFPIILSSIISTKYLPPSSAIPANVIFNPRTMEIIDVQNGSIPVEQVKAACKAAGL